MFVVIAMRSSNMRERSIFFHRGDVWYGLPISVSQCIEFTIALLQRQFQGSIVIGGELLRRTHSKSSRRHFGWIERWFESL